MLADEPPQPAFGLSFRPVWHPDHFAYLEPYSSGFRSLRWLVPLGLAVAIGGPYLMTRAHVAACLGAISAPAMLLRLPWLLLPGPLVLVYGLTSAIGVGFVCCKAPPFFAFRLVNEMHSGVLGKISLGFGTR